MMFRLTRVRFPFQSNLFGFRQNHGHLQLETNIKKFNPASYMYTLVKFNKNICMLSRHLNQHQDSHPSYSKHASSVSTSLAMGYDSNHLNLHLSPLHCSSHGPELDRPPAEMTGWKGLIFSIMANEQTWISIGIMLQSSHQMSVQFRRII